MTQALRRGFNAGLLETSPRRWSHLFTADQAAHMGKIVGHIQELAGVQGASEEQRRDLFARLLSGPVGLDAITAIVEVGVRGQTGSLGVSLEMLAIRDGHELTSVASKEVFDVSFQALQSRLVDLGRTLAVQSGLGERPACGEVGPRVTARAGRELVLDAGDTYDPEYDAFDWAWCQVGAPAGEPSPRREWLPRNRALKLTPRVDGRYTFLFWAKEVLRVEDRPRCSESSPGLRRVEIFVGPARSWTFLGLASGDLSVFDDGTFAMSSLRLGADVRVWRQLGVRGAFDLANLAPPGSDLAGADAAGSDRDAKRGPTVRPFGPATLGLSWDLRLARDLSLRPQAGLYWHAPSPQAVVQLGGVAGLDALIDLAERWALVMTIEAIRVRNTNGGFSRFRLAGGIAFRN